MSAIFENRLRNVRHEYAAAREAISYVNRNWQKHNIADETTSEFTPQHFKNAALSLEAVYLIRLFAVFEGILKEHLSASHPHISVPEDAKAIWLINRVSTLQRPPVSTPLRDKVHDVRKYRNFLVHPGGSIANAVLFSDALAALARFADRLPDPIR